MHFTNLSLIKGCVRKLSTLLFILFCMCSVFAGGVAGLFACSGRNGASVRQQGQRGAAQSLQQQDLPLRPGLRGDLQYHVEVVQPDPYLRTHPLALRHARRYLTHHLIFFLCCFVFFICLGSMELTKNLSIATLFKCLQTTSNSYLYFILLCCLLLLLLVLFPAGAVSSGKTAIAAKLAAESEFPFIRMISPTTMIGYNESRRCQTLLKVGN